VTGAPQIESASEAVALGALRYLTKPVNIEELERVAHKAVRMHRLARINAKRSLSSAWTIDSSEISPGWTRVRRCLTSLWMAYQPIVLWSGQSVFAYEALCAARSPRCRAPRRCWTPPIG
jgi:DNA-binding NtrC family response regulator